MSKLNWRAKVDYEFLNNYKILQAILDKFGIKKYIEVLILKFRLKSCQKLNTRITYNLSNGVKDIMKLTEEIKISLTMLNKEEVI